MMNKITSADPIQVMPTTEPTDIPLAPASAATPLPDEIAENLMYLLSAGGKADYALERIVKTGDTRFIAVLIELMRALQIGLVRSINFRSLVDPLETLSAGRLATASGATYDPASDRVYITERYG
jgi:hypothetical protein